MRSKSRTLPAAASPLPFLDSERSPELIAALSTTAAPHVAGAILRTFPTGFYIGVAANPWGERILPVMGAGALQLPTGLQVPELTQHHLGELRTGMPATIILSIHAGRPTVRHVETGDLKCRAVRMWRPRRIDPTARQSHLQLSASTAASARTINCVRGQLRPGRLDLHSRSLSLVHALESRRQQEVDRCLHELLGYGPGSTPSGDDALCGISLALRFAGSSDAHSDQRVLLAQRLSAIALEQRTTALSASLLRASLEGYCIPEAERAIAEAARLIHEPEPSLRNLNVLLSEADRIGHHSGHDLLTGALAVLAPAAESAQVSPLEGSPYADDC